MSDLNVVGGNFPIKNDGNESDLRLRFELDDGDDDLDISKPLKGMSQFYLLCCNFGSAPVLLESFGLWDGARCFFQQKILLKEKLCVAAGGFAEIGVNYKDMEEIKKYCVDNKLKECRLEVFANGLTFRYQLDLTILNPENG